MCVLWRHRSSADPIWPGGIRHPTAASRAGTHAAMEILMYLKGPVAFAVEILFYPLTVFGSAVSLYYLLGVASPQQLPWVPLIPVTACVVVFMILERLMPYRLEWGEAQGDTVTDMLQTFVTLPVASKLAEAALPVVFFFPLAWLTGFIGAESWPTSMSFWLQTLAALLAAEFGYYWMHRWSHASELLWRFHAVHHGAERVYWINSGRFHFLDAFLGSFVYFLPLALLGAPEEILLMTITLSAVTGFMEHVNIRFRAGFLNYFFNTAQLHRWHHSNHLHESNTNYGKALSVWDLLFGTFHLPKGQAVKDVGIKDTRVPNSFLGQLVYPFRKGETEASSARPDPGVPGDGSGRQPPVE